MGARIVIVGAGFAGLRAALDLPATEQVTVVANRRWCEFLPNIHELLSGRRTPGSLRIDAEARVRGAGHRFVLDEITSIDTGGRTLKGRATGTIPYDILLLTPGLAGTTGGVEGAAEHALPFKSVDECARIGRRLRELAEAPGTPRVVIVGGGPLRGWLREEVQRAGLKSQVTLAGEPSDAELPAYYQAADYFVLPSTTPAEMFGIALLEAMACAKPVISTRLSTGVREVNEDGVSGIAVAPGDVQALRRRRRGRPTVLPSRLPTRRAHDALCDRRAGRALAPPRERGQ